MIQQVRIVLLHWYYHYYCAAVNVKFERSTYTIREDKSLTPVIILNQPSPVEFNLSVNLIDINTTGMVYKIYISYYAFYTYND